MRPGAWGLREYGFGGPEGPGVRGSPEEANQICWGSNGVSAPQGGPWWTGVAGVEWEPRVKEGPWGTHTKFGGPGESDCE